MKGTATEPLLLSESEDVQERFREMVRETLSSVFRSFSDGSAFSGIDPYELREKVSGLGFLPEHGRGFEAVLEDTERVILPHLLRTWSTDYMPHLHSPVLTETICSELIISCFNDSMDSWDQGPAATELEESMVRGLTGLFGLPEGSDGCFTSGGSQSNITALMAARDRYCRERLGWDVRADGLPPDFGKLRIYTSEISPRSTGSAGWTSPPSRGWSRRTRRPGCSRSALWPPSGPQTSDP